MTRFGFGSMDTVSSKRRIPVETAPFLLFFLNCPYGASAGFLGLTLPYVLVGRGFSVASVSSVTALTLSVDLWRFLWAPATELTLTLHRWWWIGATVGGGAVLVLSNLPPQPQARRPR